MKEKINVTGVIIQTVLWLLVCAIAYYVFLPALNVHSIGMWCYLSFIVLFSAFIFSTLYRVIFSGNPEKSGKVMPITGILTAVGVIILVVGGMSSASIFHAKTYSKVLVPDEYDFDEDMEKATDVTNIALMDTNSAILMGNREIGSLSQVVSQYEVSEEYAQISQNGRPLKVSALNYAGFLKYIGNKENGVPGYVKVDPVGQNADYVALDKNMQYVPSAYFSRDLKRKLRFTYPDKVFGNIHFEIDEDGNPYYIATVYDYSISLFAETGVKGAIILDPTTGESEYYALSDIPEWVDVVFDGGFITELYDWYGKLSNGFWNSIFGKKGCKKCTETIPDDADDDDDTDYVSNYGYVSKDGDIWIYTGVTSVNDDASNIGFLMVNERTGEAHHYNVAGADENSAMASAEGEVQEKGYKASFPSLINVDEQPTYIMVLKDASGIVKRYAMVNVESYNIVVTAENIDDCFKNYRKKIGSGTDEEDVSETGSTPKVDDAYSEDDIMTAEFKVASVHYVDVEGNTYVYFRTEDKKAYRQRFSDNEQLIFVGKGDTLKVRCVDKGDNIYQIVEITQ